jgi:hypothetical protein
MSSGKGASWLFLGLLDLDGHSLPAMPIPIFGLVARLAPFRLARQANFAHPAEPGCGSSIGSRQPQDLLGDEIQDHVGCHRGNPRDE